MVQLHDLPDDALIECSRHATTPEHQRAVFAVLWQRHLSFIDGQLRGMRAMTPAGYDTQTFQDDTRQRLGMQLLRRLHTYRGPHSFPAFLSMCIRSAALDERRTVLSHLRHVQLEETQSLEKRQEAQQTTTGSQESPPFRSHYHIPWPLPFAIAMERTRIVDAALTLHAQQGDRGYKSARAIRAHYLEEEYIATIAEQFRMLERTVYRLLSHDYRALRSILSQDFQIDDLSQI